MKEKLKMIECKTMSPSVLQFSSAVLELVFPIVIWNENIVFSKNEWLCKFET